MNRDYHPVITKLLAPTQPKRATRDVTALPKGSKEHLRRQNAKRAVVSASLPHSKSFGK